MSEADRVHGELLVLLASDGVQTHRGDALALEGPVLAALVLDDLRPGLDVLLREPVGPDPPVLDDVIVDADQVESHRLPPCLATPALRRDGADQGGGSSAAFRSDWKII
jgi:hypothetical protein